MGVPDEILRKDGPLTDAEWVLMRQHPDLAVQFLSGVNYLRDALDIPWCHHEKWDGTGYPRGLAGTDIPIAARIFAVIDVYDAVTSDRPYRLALPHSDVMALVHEGRGGHFDPDVVDAFERLMDANPALRRVDPLPL
jgi:HD-GYP domain-containing protein (c-di-GMP phosphodiesterase class II)